VGSHLVASIPQPGGSTTGFTNFEPSLIGKWLEILKEVAPGVTRAAVMFNPKTAHDRKLIEDVIAHHPTLRRQKLSRCCARSVASRPSCRWSRGGPL
jgi:ABC-type uncharacterized transport system substrate-binding protein